MNNHATRNNNNEGNSGAAVSRRIIRSLKAKADARRKLSERAADWMTSTFGNVKFLAINVLIFAMWIAVNTGVMPIAAPFDPFPFGLLTMMVSLEAIVLAIVVLISQNRGAKVGDLRQEVDLQVDIITEQEITKIMEMLAALMKKNGIDVANDQELQLMLMPTNMSKIEKTLEKQVIES